MTCSGFLANQTNLGTFIFPHDSVRSDTLDAADAALSYGGATFISGLAGLS